MDWSSKWQCNGVSKFPPTRKVTHGPLWDIIGVPIREYLHCAGVFAIKHAEVLKLLFRFEEVSAIDPQIGFNSFRCCSG